jgi:hypothetical protein
VRPSDWKIVRDIILVTLSSFMLLHETVFDPEPNPLIVGAALALLGLPAALRMNGPSRS